MFALAAWIGLALDGALSRIRAAALTNPRGHPAPTVCAIAGVVLLSLAVHPVGWANALERRVAFHRATSIFEFRSGVLVDSLAGQVYLMNPSGGIDAVDLSAGRLIWRTDAAARPLWLESRQLLAQAVYGPSDDRLRLILLDREDGAVRLRASASLPDGIRATVDDRLGETFRTNVRRHEDALIVSWEYAAHAVRGERLPSEVTAHTTRGAVRLDLTTGQLTIAPDQTPALPEAAPLAGGVAAALSRAEMSGPVWQVGEVLAAIERTRVTGGTRAVLRRWRADTGRALPDVALFGAELTFRYASADHRHILASKLAGSPPPVWVWRIYSLETGAQVAALNNASPAAPFFLTAETLVHEAPATSQVTEAGLVLEQPLRLRALGLASGRFLWEWPIRDPSYPGPYPPGLPGAPGSPRTRPAPRPWPGHRPTEREPTRRNRFLRK